MKPHVYWHIVDPNGHQHRRRWVSYDMMVAYAEKVYPKGDWTYTWSNKPRCKKEVN